MGVLLASPKAQVALALMVKLDRVVVVIVGQFALGRSRTGPTAHLFGLPLIIELWYHNLKLNL
jgi:hypothetical protein